MQQMQQDGRRLMTAAEYARSRDLNRSTVSRQVRDGIIPTVEAAGRRLIDPAEADAARARFLYHDRGRRKRAERGPEPVSLAAARAVKEHFLARLAQLEYEEKSGRLLKRDEVQVAQFNANRIIRDGLQNIPDRACGALMAEVASLLAAHGLSAELAAQLDLSRVHSLLDAEVRAALSATTQCLTEGHSE